MTNIEHVEKLLREYNSLCCRIRFLEKMQGRVLEATEGGDEVSKMVVYSCSGKVASREKIKKQDQLVTQLIRKTNCITDDLKRLQYTKDIIDGGLEMIKSIDERYHKVIQKYYIHGSRMEDVADWLYISRSRCYEISKLAINAMSELLFGVAAS